MMKQSRDHTYCRSPENKNTNNLYSWEFHCPRLSNDINNGVKLPVNGNCVENELEKSNNGVDKIQSVNLERLRLASDEIHIKNEKQDGFEDDDGVGEIEMLFTPCPKSNNFSSVNDPLFDVEPTSAIRISRDPSLSAFVPWERIKNGDRIDHSALETPVNTKSINERDEFSVFGDYVASEVRSIKGKYHQAIVKKKIQDAIFEVQMMWLKNTQNGRTEHDSNQRATSQ